MVSIAQPYTENTMGVWGSGNFESDGTLDIVGMRSDELINRLWENMKSKRSTEADESYHDELFVDLEWVLALDEAGCFNGWSLPPTDEFDEVAQEWLDAWSDYFDGLSGPEFKAERRAVIEETFAKFREVCANYEERRS